MVRALIAILIVASFVLCGCNAMTSSWKGSNAGPTVDTHNTPQTQQAGDVANQANAQQSDNAAATSDSDKNNAILEGEDDASKARRDRAKKSLGL